jgi:hypothetical protein
MTLFLLQVVRNGSTKAVQLPGGGKMEIDLIDACTEAIVRRKVGYFRSEAHVRQAIKAGITETIDNLKLQTVKCQ